MLLVQFRLVKANIEIMWSKTLFIIITISLCFRILLGEVLTYNISEMTFQKPLSQVGIFFKFYIATVLLSFFN